MPSEDILRKVIEKAVYNGLAMESVPNYCKACKEVHHLPQPEAFIFSHDFAKAFWNDTEPHQCNDIFECCTCTDWDEPAWRWNLQQLALAEDRLAYLEKFL